MTSLDPYDLAKQPRQRRGSHHRRRHVAAGKPTYAKTNSLSMSHSRPAPPLLRLVNKQENRDYLQHGADDCRITAPQRFPLGRKSMAALLGTREDAARRPNASLCWFARAEPSPSLQRRKRPPRLAEVAPGVWIGNAAAWAVSGHDLAAFSAADGMTDSRTLPFGQWQRRVQAGVGFIRDQRARNRSVLVFCQGGVNRSSSVIAAFLITQRGLTVKQAVRAIEGAKATVDPLWDTLTNPRLLQHLRKLQGGAGGLRA